eukprot:m.17690 g.17690  ORF g.17690 m.17690 type:complete len:51 (+) comp6082_c0_seq1:345-497(+)
MLTFTSSKSKKKCNLSNKRFRLLCWGSTLDGRGQQSFPLRFPKSLSVEIA